ncbi:MAG: hypothetical protein EBZ54_03900, partial [Actinobacteria bacterium]|nr:hypothetical protein [Actinomycetota bacterium]
MDRGSRDHPQRPPAHRDAQGSLVRQRPAHLDGDGHFLHSKIDLCLCPTLDHAAVAGQDRRHTRRSGHLRHHEHITEVDIQEVGVVLGLVFGVIDRLLPRIVRGVSGVNQHRRHRVDLHRITGSGYDRVDGRFQVGEGRLAEPDALAEADSENPELIVDFATLTGAARVALGPELPAVFSNDSALLNDIKRCGDLESDPVWPMPLWDSYDEEL